MSKYLKKLSHKYEFLKLELEEVTELVEEYGRTWSSLFGKYLVDRHSVYWVNEETGEIRYKPPGDEVDTLPKKDHPDKVRKLYKKLSTFTHPDKGGNVDDFTSIKEAYEEGDLLELLRYAGLFNVEYAVDEEDEKLIEEVCKNLETKIQEQKNTMAWNYCTGGRSKKLGVIKAMESQFGIKIPLEEYPEDLLEN